MWNKISNHSSIKSISVLVSGSIIANLITFLCSPLLTRIYSQEEFGGFTLVLSIIAIFGVIVNGRYDVVIVTAEDKELIPLIQLSILLSVIISLLVTLGCWGYTYYTDDAFLRHALVFIFLLLLITGIINVLNSYNNRGKDYSLMTKVYLYRSIWQNSMMLGFGKLYPSAFSLLASQFLGQLFCIKKQKGKLSWADLFDFKTKFSYKISLLKKFKSQILLSAPASLLNAVSYSIINLLIAYKFGLAMLGLYSISVRLLGLPLNIFSSNIAKVHYADSISEREANGHYRKSTRRTILISMALIVPIMIILYFFAPMLVSIIFGETWEEAGVFISILTPMFALRFITGSLGFSFLISQRQGREFLFQLLLLFVVLLLFFIDTFNSSITTFLISISICFSLIYFTEIIYLVTLSQQNRSHIK